MNLQNSSRNHSYAHFGEQLRRPLGDTSSMADAQPTKSPDEPDTRRWERLVPRGSLGSALVCVAGGARLGSLKHVQATCLGPDRGHRCRHCRGHHLVRDAGASAAARSGPSEDGSDALAGAASVAYTHARSWVERRRAKRTGWAAALRSRPGSGAAPVDRGSRNYNGRTKPHTSAGSGSRRSEALRLREPAPA